MKTSDVRSRRASVDAQQWERVKSIVAEALKEESARARTALAIEQCAGDPDLLDEVNSLLSAAEVEPGDALEECAQHAADTLWRDDLSRSGQRFGAYVALRELGSGGMGTVYLAERHDGQFEKQVAIKVLKRGTDTNDVLQRFANERRILARLDHPNIARLLDAGTTDDGLPYFVMDLIIGTPVTQFVREQKLSIEARLELFLKVCAAVEIAHKAGVIHRDLKPNNILVNSEGEPKLLDFGIAKLLEPGDALDVTATERQHLTLSSASPEQARGEAVSEAADIYALGVLLYEMLTGATPYRFGSVRPARDEVVRTICEEEPRLPSAATAEPQLRRRLRGDLDNIISVALRKEAARRYASVLEFANDIRRHLRGEAVQAGPTSVTYRVGRFVRRHQLLTARSLVVAATLLAVGGGIAALFLTDSKLGRSSGLGGDAHKAVGSAGAKSIAVLPFHNLSAAPENAFFATGVQDAILTDLAKIAELKVINRTSVQQYASDAPRDLQRISDQLDVAYVLEGSVQRSESRLRLTAKLTDARNQAQVWAERYDRELSDVFAVQSEIARKIADQLRATLSPQEQASIDAKPTRDMAAYDLYLRAMQMDRNVGPSAGLIESQVALLEEAVARDPQFIRAHCQLARFHLQSYALYFDRSAARVEKGREAIAAASRVDPAAPDVVLARAISLYWVDRDYGGALDLLKQARQSLPNDVDIPFFIGLIARRQGLWEESIRHLSEAAALDPFNAAILYQLGATHLWLRRYDDAARLFDRILAGRDNDLTFQSARAIVDVNARGDLRRLEKLVTDGAATAAAPNLLVELRLQLAMLKHDYAAASEVLADAPPLPDPHGSLAAERQFIKGVIASRLGDEAAAQAALSSAHLMAARLVEAAPNDPAALMLLAQTYAWLGDAENARREGERAVQLLSVTPDAAVTPKMLLHLAAMYGHLGERARALDLLEQAAKLPGGLHYGALMREGSWDRLRSEPRFQKLIASLAPK